MNTPISYPIAKLLKKKGFDIPVNSCYSGDEFCLNYSIINQYSQEYFEDKGECLIIPYSPFDRSVYLETINFNDWGDNSYSAPEQWQIMEWLRVNHGIHIEVSCDVYGELWYANLFVCSKEVWEDEDKRHNILTANRKFINEHKSKQEAYESAFDYILNELI
jgi:hypothetical protein